MIPILYCADSIRKYHLRKDKKGLIKCLKVALKRFSQHY